jgi:hypothetical protein
MQCDRGMIALMPALARQIAPAAGVLTAQVMMTLFCVAMS